MVRHYTTLRVPLGWVAPKNEAPKCCELKMYKGQPGVAFSRSTDPLHVQLDKPEHTVGKQKSK